MQQQREEALNGIPLTEVMGVDRPRMRYLMGYLMAWIIEYNLRSDDNPITAEEIRAFMYSDPEIKSSEERDYLWFIYGKLQGDYGVHLQADINQSTLQKAMRFYDRFHKNRGLSRHQLALLLNEEFDREDAPLAPRNEVDEQFDWSELEEKVELTEAQKALLVTQKNCVTGMPVAPGPDFKWKASQLDGAVYGEVVDDSQVDKGWCRVQWYNKYKMPTSEEPYWYRVGAEDAFDLYIHKTDTP